MRTLLLAWRYLTYHRALAFILVICLTISMFLPLCVNLMVDYYERDLIQRSQATPLLIGARGNRYDLVLKSLYFTAEQPETIAWSEVEMVLDSGRGIPIPLHVRYSAQRQPVAGTSPEYFEFRGLSPKDGTLPLMLGDAVLGAGVARKLNLNVGDYLLTDQASLYDLASVYPLKMKVVGILNETHSPDDHAVFVDYKTTWVIEGIGHGHTDLAAADRSVILKREEKNVVGNAAVLEYTEITRDNINEFHFHGDWANFPLTSVIVLPESVKSATLVKSQINASKTIQMLVPLEVIEELLGVVFRVKRFFDANFLLVAIATALFMVLVVMLSLRIRQREMETMFRIGCSRMTIFWLQVSELAIILLISAGLAGILSSGVLVFAPGVLRTMSH
ncbi:MAG: ABC transporter permease [Planctomycetota bacterium]|jgi:putative ABC transport system permease protein|nr:ABC transporter permease [Planctomycetota bacterium]